MSKLVIKRNNIDRELFDENRVAKAIMKANETVDENKRLSFEDISVVVKNIELLYSATENTYIKDEIPYEDIELTVDEIQRVVLDSILSISLNKGNGTELYDNYLLYMSTQELKRNIEQKSGVEEVVLSLTGHEQKKKKVSVSDIDLEKTTNYVKNENSNKNAEMASTQRDLIAGEFSRDLSKRFLIPHAITEAHNKGWLHFHDLDYFIQPIFNCCLINLGDMLDNGTVMNGKMIESPKSFRVACTVTSQIIASVASNQYGGQSVDVKHLAKYVRVSEEKIRRKRIADGLTGELLEKVVSSELKEEVKAGVQTIQYQINTLMTTNGQSPFVTLFMMIDPDYEYVKENVMVIMEILEQRLTGIKNEAGVYVTPAFPKLVYVLDECNNLTGGEYDYVTELAVKCSAKRMYPDYISAKKMRENYQGNVFSPMGCRSFLAPWKDEDGNFKFEGRFNQGVVSLNLPSVALEATKELREAEEMGFKITEELRRNARNKFWTVLDERLSICFKALMIRHNALLGVTSDISPIHWQHGAIARLEPGEKIDKYLYGGYSSISLGYIGVYETTKLITGVSNTAPEGEAFAVELMQYLRQTTDRWKKQTNIGFALYGTPAESLCYRFARIDEKEYGIIEDITDKGYYTNSYHVDVRENIDVFSKFKFESQFQPISSGGCISYAEIPNMENNLEALKKMVSFIYENIQYAEFNTKSDYCYKCGFDGEIIVNEDNEWECPVCHNKDHSKMSVIRRTCGYLGENFWNVGKTKEISKRVLHTRSESLISCGCDS